MNIFVTDDCPIQSAINLPDKLIVKMPLETAQLFAADLILNGFQPPPKKDGTLYKLTHRNHPSRVWLSKCKENWDWLLMHWEAMLDEYSERYNKTHGCVSAFQYVASNYLDFVPLSSNKPITFSKAISIEPYKSEPDVIKAYRGYMIETKSYYAKWNKKPESKPDWWVSVD